MERITDGTVFREGRFYDYEGNLKARVSQDKHLIREAYGYKIVGHIRDGKLYDEMSNYVGYFKDGTLYTLGGRIMGHCGSWKLDDTPKRVQDDGRFWENVVLIAGIIVGLGFLFLKISQIFF